jgi:hypothetical protein
MKRYSTALIVSLCLLFTINVSAQPWKKVIHVLGKVVETSVKVVTAPTETVVKAGGVVIGVNKPQDILDPIKNVAKTGGSAIKDAADVVIDPQRKLYEKADKFASKFGKPGRFIFDVSTFSQNFYTELGYASVVTLGNALKGENPLVIAGAPLAAAIHAARNKYANDAKSLPQDVIDGLKGKGIFSDEVLGKAKWVRGNVEITLPNFIGKGAKYQGDHYAVVVEDIIVFNVQPPSFKEDAWWWTHEITHIEQFARWDVELFAYNYLKDHNAIENEANNRGYDALTKLDVSNGLKNVVYPMAKILKQDISLDFNEIVVSQCIFDKDTIPVSYLVTSKGNIYAVDPVTTKYIHIGYAKPPKYAGTLWTFSTPKLTYSITSNGDILTYVKVSNPLGNTIDFQSVKVGHVNILHEQCKN